MLLAVAGSSVIIKAMSFNVGKDTTINDSEYIADSYVIPFAPELTVFILEEKKLSTYRFGNKYDYIQIGDMVSLQNSATKNIFACAMVTAKSKVEFIDLPIKSNIHESYESKEHQRGVLSGYYKYLKRPLRDDDEFTVFQFALVT